MFTALALAQSYTFAVVGHTRGGPGNGTLPMERYDELVREVRRCKPAFVVLTGDLVYGDFEAREVDRAAVESDWDAVDRVFARFECPVHRVPGNHDLWDPTTRDLWTERYGELQKSFDYEGSKFLLLNSCWTPAPGETGQCPPRFIRGVQLDDSRVRFVEGEIEGARDAAHVFAFLGHVLWWDDEASWWSDVHPLLSQVPTRAVFSGDLGPWKFSHQQRDGIHYIQSAVEFTVPPTVMQRNRESIRSISEQLDNFALVTVDGDAVRIEIRTLGALESGRFTPAKYREVHEYDAGSFERKVFNRMDTPEKLVGWLWKLGGAAALGGAMLGAGLTWILRRRA
ncbi:MAG: metallophosphoesterase [Planctomycetes bacterium]|nr:metallophosphoesterase [Planctomycetota bacterium]